MRVIGGKFKRRSLTPPAPGSTKLRPTYDSIRENIFNLLGDRVAGASFLDLYAGAGAVGIEAISRGASRCLFVDSSAESAALVKRNCAGLGIGPETYTFVRADAPSFLRRTDAAKFAIIFFDPPYASGLFAETLKILGGMKGMPPDALVVGQSGEAVGEEACGGLELADSRRYGRTWVSIWKPA